MKTLPKVLTLLLADDDDDDYLLTKRALEAAQIRNPLYRVCDGEDLLDYLHRRGRHADPANAPYPSLLLLDLNMPRMDGREALKEIKSDPQFRHLPVVILTTSRSEEDVVRSYGLGVNAFMQKPVRFDGLVAALLMLGRYWLEIVELPPTGPHAAVS